MSPTGQPRIRFVAVDVPRGTGFGRHRHDTHQLLSVESGALAVGTEAEHWAVPARRGVWLPADLDHELVAVDDARVTFAYIGPARASIRSGGPAGGRRPSGGAVVGLTGRPIRGRVVAIRPLLARRSACSPGRRQGRSADPARGGLPRRGGRPATGRAPRRAAGLPAGPRGRRRPAGRPGRATQPRRPGPGHVGASSRTLQRRFRVRDGLTFQRWRRRARVQSSMGPWPTGRRSPRRRTAAGSPRASAFIAAFRAETGTTPTRRLADRRSADADRWRSLARTSGALTRAGWRGRWAVRCLAMAQTPRHSGENSKFPLRRASERAMITAL